MALAIKIAITPKASGQPSYEILDLIVVSGRAYLSLKDENTSAVTDTTAWMQITENTYDIAVRLGYVGTEAQWLASLSAASEAAAVIALDAAGDANDAATAANAAAGLAQDAATSANTAAANITSTVPWSLYRSRVLADSGVISDLEKLTKLYIENLKLLDNTVFLWDGSAGIKTRTSGINQYATKLYDMSASNRDAVQATEANQPHVGGGIAPNEKRKIKGLTGETGTKGLTGSDIQIASSGAFTLAFAVKWNYPRTSSRIYLSATNYIELTASAITLRGDSGNVLTCSHNFRAGLTEILTFEYSNGAGLIRVNGVEKTTTATSGAVTFGSLFLNQTSYNFDGEISKLQIANVRLSAAQIQSLYNFTRLQHPEIEGINIGNQHWATSNYEGVVTGNGTVIPEVQLASNSVNLIPQSSSDFETDGTAYYDYIFRCTKEYNSTEKCLRLIGTTNGDNVVFGKSNALTIGKLYRIEFDIKSSNTNIATPGLQPIAFGNINVIQAVPLSTNYQTFIAEGVSLTGNLGLYAANTGGIVGATYDIDNIKVYEKGWADLTTPAWCYHDNNPLNVAVYGKEYNGYATDAISINAPDGWRVPTDADFQQLINFVGAAGAAKLIKDGVMYWNSAFGTNETGMSIIGAGIRADDGSFTSFQIKQYASFHSATSASATTNKIFSITNGLAGLGVVTTSKLRGRHIRLIRNEPVGATERTVETGYITNALGATNLDIVIPFGYQVESVRIDSETDITGLSAKLLTGGLTELETLFTAKSVTANVQKVIAADADQSIQQTDAVVRINGTKADTTKRFRVWVKLTKVVFS